MSPSWIVGRASVSLSYHGRMNKRLSQQLLASLLGISLATGCSPDPSTPPAPESKVAPVALPQAILEASRPAAKAEPAHVEAELTQDVPSEPAPEIASAKPSVDERSGPLLQIPPSDRPGPPNETGAPAPLPDDVWADGSLSIDEELALLEGTRRLPPVNGEPAELSATGELYVAQAPPDWSLSRRLQQARDWQSSASSRTPQPMPQDEVDGKLAEDETDGPVRLSPVEEEPSDSAYRESSNPVWNGSLERLPSLGNPMPDISQHPEFVNEPAVESTAEPTLVPLPSNEFETSADDAPPSQAVVPLTEPEWTEATEVDEAAEQTAEPESEDPSVSRGTLRPRSLDDLDARQQFANAPEQQQSPPTETLDDELSWPAIDTPRTVSSPDRNASTELAELPARGPQPEPLPAVEHEAESGQPSRPAEMDAVARRAIEQTRSGFLLARRGAIYVARTEFVASLRLIAQAQDLRERTDRHSQALANGLRALDETNDLVPRGSQLETDIDIVNIVSRHRTASDLDVDLEQLSTTELLGHYYTFAQQRLAAATGGEPAGSMALHGLGKVHAILAQDDRATATVNEAKAMVYHQAALLVDRGNYLAANDLGVLLAHYGRFAESRDMLLHSATIWPQAKTFDNLANVHRQLGEHDLAQRAIERSLALSQQGSQGGAGAVAASKYGVQWVSPQELAGGPSTAPAPRAAVRPKGAQVDRRATLDRPHHPSVSEAR